MARKIRVGVIFGGRSGEHEVSLTSAHSVLEYLDPDKYEIVPIGISKEGRWLLGTRPNAQQAQLEHKTVPVSLLPDPNAQGLVALSGESMLKRIDGQLDVIFPVLHGTYGEDGTVQGLLELADIPYVGAGVAASAVGMDKALMKSVFAAHGLPQLPYLVVKRRDWETHPDVIEAEVRKKLGFPCFVKPANLGSSVGISKVHNGEELAPAMDLACSFDRKVVIEQSAPPCREIECAVLGNDEPEASVLGEIVPSREFYDYEAKYIDNASELIIPARVSDKTAAAVREMAVAAFRAIDCAGMARVDFFVAKDDETIYLNEINTIPGFTPISMYPKLWDASGVSYPELLDRLIQLAIERYEDKKKNRTSYL